MTIPTWDDYYINLCKTIATRSKDNSTQLGAVIVDKYNTLLSQGYNSFPRGINDSLKSRQLRPNKYYYFEHAERNAIYNACRSGISLLNSKLYVPWLPCSDCARAIIQSGIKEVIIENNFVEERWQESAIPSLYMFLEAEIKVRLPNSNINEIDNILDSFMLDSEITIKNIFEKLTDNIYCKFNNSFTFNKLQEELSLALTDFELQGYTINLCYKESHTLVKKKTLHVNGKQISLWFS